jgi:hypothetical protein
LRRETWGAQPASQTMAVSDSALSQDVVRAFEEAFSREQSPSLKVTCLRAIVFFGAALTDEQEHFVEANAGNQMDRLSR